jgi:hypothetical protein
MKKLARMVTHTAMAVIKLNLRTKKPSLAYFGSTRTKLCSKYSHKLPNSTPTLMMRMEMSTMQMNISMRPSRILSP